MNAAQLAAFRLQAQDAEDELNPCEVKINGVTIKASCRAQASGLALQLGGPAPDNPQMFRIRKAFLPTRPLEAKTKLESDGKTYRVEKIDGDSPTAPAWLLTCNIATR